MKRQHNSFLTPLVVEVMPSGKRFKLHYDFTYLWHCKNHSCLCPIIKVKVSVPAGFETDFASIPRFAQVLIPKLGRYNKAAVIHDYLYQTHNIDFGDFLKFGFNRTLADKCFRDAMKDLGVAKWKRNLMYWCCRLGGFFAWRKG